MRDIFSVTTRTARRTSDPVSGLFDQLAQLARAAVLYADTWRPCYVGCDCIRCDLASQAHALRELVDGDR